MFVALFFLLRVTAPENIVSRSAGVHLLSSEQPVALVHSAKQIKSGPFGTLVLRYGRTIRTAPFEVEAEGTVMQKLLYGVAECVSVDTDNMYRCTLINF